MADRRRFFLGRKLLSLLPRFLRYRVMRNQLKISEELDPRFKFCIARTQGQLSEAYRILQESYVEMGYSKENISGMRIIKYFALPSTTTLVALYDDKVVGTLSIIRRGSFGLPMDNAFSLSEFIERNEVIAEISSLAIDSKFRQKRGALFLPLLKYFWQYVEKFMHLDSIVITVNPSMSDFYEGFLGFKRLKKAVVTSYQFANGHPGVGLYLNVKEAPQKFAKLYGHKPANKNLHRYFVKLDLPHFTFPERNFNKSSDPVMTPDMLNYFFIKKSTVFADLNIQEKMALASSYPSLQYKRVLPEVQRKFLRHAVNIKARHRGSEELTLTILDISLVGICVATQQTRLNGILDLEVPVAENKVSRVKGEVRWKDWDRNIFGIHLTSTDQNWNDFVAYMSEDFHDLCELPDKKSA
jgi:hypothetical protein